MNVKKILRVWVIILLALFAEQFMANANVCTFCACYGVAIGICNCSPTGNDTCAWCVHSSSCDASCTATEQCGLD